MIKSSFRRREKFKFLATEEERELSLEELKSYYACMRNYYSKKPLFLGNMIFGFFHKIYGFFSKYIRNYELEIRGINNIPIEENVIFACNHSNSNDTYTMHETFRKLFRPLVGSDCLNVLSYSLIGLAGGVFINRNNKKSCIDGANKFVGKIISGSNAVVFPEGTWCLHPAKPLLPFKAGIIRIATKTAREIVPVIFEYHEVDKYCTKANEVIDKCIVQIGNPISVKEEDSVLEKLEELRTQMATMRWMLWEEYGVYKRKDFDPYIYENHNELKLNTPLFKYDYKNEEKFILHSDDFVYQEYPINRIVMKREREL